MTKAMTEGNIFKHIFYFSLPIVFGNLFQQAYNLADAAIVGRTLGSNALGSVGVSSSIQFMVLGFCTGTAMGFTIPIATEFGAERHDRMRKYYFNGEILLVITAVLLTALTMVLCKPILHLLKTPDELYSDAYAYLFTIFAGIPFTLLYNYLSSVLRAIGDSKTPFLFLAFSATLNIFLDFFCILRLNMGVFGAAFATVVSQAISGILCFIYLKKKINILRLNKEDRVFDKVMALKSVNIGVPMGLQYSITAIGSMVMQIANNSLGTVYVSAYAAGLKIKQFMMSPLTAFASATATFISQNYGAEKPDRIKKGLETGWLIAVVYGCIAALVMNLFGKNLSQLFLDSGNTEIISASAKYLAWIGLFYPMLGTLDIFRQSMQGIGRSRLSVVGGVLEMIARIFVCAVFTSRFGFNAICCADQAAWTSAVLFLIPAMYQNLKRIKQEIIADQAARKLHEACNK